jgi:hypothetical protein
MTLTPAECCCDGEPPQPDPCLAQDTYSPITLCYSYLMCENLIAERKYTGGCQCGLEAACPGEPGQDPPVYTPPPTGCGSALVINYKACDCPFSFGAVCWDNLYQAYASFTGCVSIPFKSQGQVTTGAYFITASGNPVGVAATYSAVRVEYELPVAARLAWSCEALGPCGSSESWSLVPQAQAINCDGSSGGVPGPYRVLHTGPPYVTQAPSIWTIRRQTSSSVASTWEITSTKFVIRNTAGTIVYETTTTGKTIGQVFTEVDTQTAAPVQLVKQYAAGGSIAAFSVDPQQFTDVFEAQGPSTMTGLTVYTIRAYVLAAGQSRRAPLITIANPPYSILVGTINVVTPWSLMGYDISGFAPHSGVTTWGGTTFWAFAADNGWTEASVSALCSGFARSWDNEQNAIYAAFDCQGYVPGTQPSGQVPYGSYTTAYGNQCGGEPAIIWCPFTVTNTNPCTYPPGFIGGGSWGSLATRDFPPNGQGTTVVNTFTQCTSNYGGSVYAWSCDPFESEANCCCPEINGNNCEDAFRTFSGCLISQSGSYGEWDYLFTVTR